MTGPPDIKKSSLPCRGRGISPASSRCVTDGTLDFYSIDPAAFCATPILSEETKHRRMKAGRGVGGVVQIFGELLQGKLINVSFVKVVFILQLTCVIRSLKKVSQHPCKYLGFSVRN